MYSFEDNSEYFASIHLLSDSYYISEFRFKIAEYKLKIVIFVKFCITKETERTLRKDAKNISIMMIFEKCNTIF